MSQFHFKPERYLELMRQEVPAFDALQEQLAEATRGLDVERMLELGTGTGETAHRVLDVHPKATLVGIDVSPEMLEEARSTLRADRVDLHVARLQDALPAGPFELVFSALAVHHLDPAGKRDLFARVAAALGPAGRFVLADVVVPEDPADAVAPLTEGYDLPDTVEAQLEWLGDAGFEPRVTWSHKDLAVVSAEWS